jgi:hypothetical protein
MLVFTIFVQPAEFLQVRQWDAQDEFRSPEMVSVD